MVGFDPAIKNPNQPSKLSYPEDQFDPLLPESPDFSLSAVDPFDFGSIDDWILQSDPFGMPNVVSPCPNGSDLPKVEFEDFISLPVEETQREADAENMTAVGSDIKMVEGRGTEDFDTASCIEVKMEKVISEVTESLPEVNEEVGNEASLMDFGSSEGLLVGEKHKETIERNLIVDGADMKMLEAREPEVFGSASCIEAKMEKVSLFGTSDSLSPVNGDVVLVNSDISECLQEVKSQVNEERGNEGSLDVTSAAKLENANCEGDAESSESDDSDSDSEVEDNDASSTTSSSSASSSDEEDEKTVEVGEAEEGEIRDLIGEEMIGGSDDDDVGAVKGPIKSKNEIEVLPHVPNVDVSLEPHHQTLPVGVILTIMGAKVIVEGLEEHNPLNEGSILWITESRSLLGLVDEIFGPVKNPYYVVRYNSDGDVPSGIHEGTPVSFVAEFADHIISKNLYKKGYDASGENDEELSDEAEFSDDEKEAEHRRMQRVAKRGSDDKKHGNRESYDRKKAQNKAGVWKSNQPPPPQLVDAEGQPPHVPNITNTPPVGTPVGSGGWTQPFGTGPTSAYNPAFAPSVSQAANANGYTPQHLVSSNGLWSNGMPCQQQQNIVFPNGFQSSGVPYQNQHQMLQNQHQMLQNQFQNQHQMLQNQHQMLMGFPNGMSIQQQIPYGQPNFSSGPPMPVFMGQAGFNQTQFGMGFQGQHSHNQINEGDKVPSHRPFVQQSHGFNQAQPGMGFQGDQLPSNVNQGGQVQSQGPLNEQNHVNFSAQQQFSQGENSTRGRRPYQRGRGGRHPSRGRGRR